MTSVTGGQRAGEDADGNNGSAGDMTDVEVVGSRLAVEESVSRAGGDKDSKGENRERSCGGGVKKETTIVGSTRKKMWISSAG